MNGSKTQKLLWCVIVGALLCGVIWELAPLPNASSRMARLPQSGFGVSSVEVPLGPAEKEILKNAGVLRREYNLLGSSLLLTIIDGTNDRHAVHDPFYCIRGSGWEIVSENSFPIPGGEARLIRVRKNDHEAEAMVWFSDGRKRHPSASKYWWQTTLRRLSLGASGPEPVLVNLQASGPKAVNWHEVIARFPGLFDV
jgi:hypothetical protein